MPITDELRENMSKIAGRIVGVSRDAPELVRLQANPMRVNDAIAILKECGFRKPFLMSKTQFIYNTFLSSYEGCQILLPYTLLAGDESNPGEINCWNGGGEFAGTQGFLHITNFASGNKDRLILVLDCNPFFGMVEQLLQKSNKAG